MEGALLNHVGARWACFAQESPEDMSRERPTIDQLTDRPTNVKSGFEAHKIAPAISHRFLVSTAGHLTEGGRERRKGVSRESVVRLFSARSRCSST